MGLIKIKQPAMALNAVDVPGARYKMENTMEVRWGIPAASLAANIRDVANGFPATPPRKIGDKWVSEFRMRNLVLNAHGAPGQIKLGQWINSSHAKEFGILKGLVGTIWIVACRVAGREVDDDLDPWDIASRTWYSARNWVTGRPPASASGTAGDEFCFKLAVTTGAKVIASPQYQVGDPFSVPFGRIDGYEGNAYIYSPDRTKKRSSTL